MKSKIECAHCGSIFERENREINRSKRKGVPNYCSRRCNGLANFDKKIPIELRHQYDISKHSSNIRDEFTGIREILKRVKGRKKGFSTDLDLKYLKDLWDKQNICVYSKVQLKLPNYIGVNDSIYTASLDRINSDIPYIKGNVQYISIAMNHMKHSMSHEKTLELLGILRNI